MNENGKVSCDHCDATWVNLGSSTSTPLKHITQSHFAYLTDEQKLRMSHNGETSGKCGTVPKRTLKKIMSEDGPLPRSHDHVKKVDNLLAKFLITSTVSWNVLDNRHFAAYSAEILKGRYNLPSRSYMVHNVISPMFHETKENIKNKLKNIKYIALTTDAWTSIAQKSFITVTAHFMDEDCKLVCYVLDTTEIKKRHTAENLLAHIQKVLSDYDIDVEQNHRLTLNFNATNTNDIHEDDIENENEINYLENENNDDDDDTQVEDIGFNIITQEENTQNNQNSQPVTSRQSSAYHDITFVSDNASDITKAIKTLGKYIWFGCAGHHLNLIAQAGFKQVQTAASLVKKCKKIVEHIKSSTPASYLLIRFQEELELPIHRVLQENGTRWWSILLMMISLIENIDAVSLVLGQNKKGHLILTPIEIKDMNQIISLLTPFKDCGEKLSSEKNVTISLISPLFEKIKKHLSANEHDTTMITNMKEKC